MFKFLHKCWQILRRVHNSYLWLLEPTYIKEERDSRPSNVSHNVAVQNILSYAKAAGVDPKRILFASRASKVEHIVRHAAGDLFLDTLIYGAHSTATDSMRGVPTVCSYVVRQLFIN